MKNTKLSSSILGLGFLCFTQTALGEIQGVGSLIQPEQSCWGCNKDEARMHPSNNYTAVVFQSANYTGKCPYVRIEGPSSDLTLGGRTFHVYNKPWAGDPTTNTLAYTVTLPVTIPSRGAYTTTMLEYQSSGLGKTLQVLAYCVGSDSHASRRGAQTSQWGVGSDWGGGNFGDMIWAGNGSIISTASGCEGGYGCNKDWANQYGFYGVSFFQWRPSSSCRRLTFSGTEGSTPKTLLTSKSWSSSSWHTYSNLTLPRSITVKSDGSEDGNYYIYRIELLGSMKEGEYIQAACN